MQNNMSLSDKLSRLYARLHDSEWRRYGMLLLTSKFAAIGLLMVAAIFINPGLMGMRVFAADPALKGNDIVNPINTVWTLVAAFLVFGMQVGFTMLEAGFFLSTAAKKYGLQIESTKAAGGDRVYRIQK